MVGNRVMVHNKEMRAKTQATKRRGWTDQEVVLWTKAKIGFHVGDRLLCSRGKDRAKIMMPVCRHSCEARNHNEVVVASSKYMNGVEMDWDCNGGQIDGFQKKTEYKKAPQR